MKHTDSGSTSYRLFTLFTVLGIVLTSNLFAAKPQDEVSSYLSLHADRQEDLLQILVQDVEAVSNACLYVTKRVEYIKETQTLHFDIETQPCPIDRIGYRAGLALWVMPMALQAGGNLRLVINGSEAADLVFDSESVELRPVVKNPQELPHPPTDGIPSKLEAEPKFLIKK